MHIVKILDFYRLQNAISYRAAHRIKRGRVHSISISGYGVRWAFATTINLLVHPL